ncbi:MAG TPA: hypothetical protein VHV78_11505, partial [Gemmatimonadaceae bacterium]|nr:hypothetical protein [Gemmatimonadaceae bacterium]
MRTFEFALLVTMLGCGKSEKHVAYETLAERLNPAVLSLRADAATILAIDPKSLGESGTRPTDAMLAKARAIVTTCRDAKAPVLAIAGPEVDFPDEVQVLGWPRAFSQGLPVSCPANADADDTIGCARFCLEIMKGLQKDLETLRVDATAAGVDI